MICQECGERPATVHITKIINNNKQQLNLCEFCAKEYQLNFGFGMKPDFSIEKFLLNMLQPETEMERKSSFNNEYHCPECGLNLDEFRESGKLGCDKCYDTFKQSLQSLLRRIQGNIQHRGKIPERIGGNLKLRQKIEGLKEKLRETIKLEEFEEAAKIRDKIRELEKGVQ